MEKTKVRTPRNPALDLVRSIAILCVILCHTTGRVFSLNAETLPQLPAMTYCGALGLHLLGRLGVPLFFFLTGYLLLDREYDGEQTVRFWRQKLLPLLVTSELWIAIYYLWSVFVDHGSSSFRVLAQQMLFLSAFSANHLWYMGQILGIYLFLPFVARLLKMAEVNQLLPPLLVAIFFCFVPNAINSFYSALSLDKLSIQFHVGFSGEMYGLMVLLGWVAKQGWTNRFTTWQLWTGMLLGLLGGWYQMWFSYEHEVTYNIWYSSGFLLLAAFCLFLLILRIKEIPFPNLLACLSKNSFGIYLIHNLINPYLCKNLPINSHLGLEITTCLLTLGLSWLSVWLLSRNRKLGLLLFRSR